METGLAGKLVLVTGSTAGIGKAIAASFVQLGAHVIINGRSKDTCHTVATELIALKQGAVVHEVPGDLSSAEGCNAVIAAVRSIGDVDVLVNNVGVFQVENFFEVTDEQWERYHNINIMSVVRMTRAFMPKMLEKNAGRVLVIASEAGSRPLPHMIPYSTSKGSLITLSRGLAELTKGTNVTVNSVLAGPTMTEGVEKYVADLAKTQGKSTADTVREYFQEPDSSTSLIQRFLRVEEVANVTVFLASDLASGINGAAQKIEGGIIRGV